jgi:hypothetical protein
MPLGPSTGVLAERLARLDWGCVALAPEHDGKFRRFR